ncbi:MAG: mitochondrial fission ELM1 family protein [Phycisphaeraceae bacterium]
MRPTIYIVSDGKPGHLAQSRGLADAIARRVDINTVEINLTNPSKDADRASARDGLVLSAGRRTYTHALGFARDRALPAIALMNPGWLKRKRFGLCVIPRHDGVAESRNVVVTEGALNGITPATNSAPNQALLLIGGPSKHHRWEDESMLAQLHTLLSRDPDVRWTATGSRRTPDATDKLLRRLADEHGGRFLYTPASETPRGWVAEQLSRCGVCWVSEDSVSMVYEALTAGARVGLLEVPRRPGKPGRVVRGVESLAERGWVTPFHDWRAGQALSGDRPALAEADRVADVILQRWPSLTNG